MGALEEAEVGEDGEGAVGAGLAEEAELLALAVLGFALEAEGGVGEAASGVGGGEVAHEGDEGIGPGEEGGVVGDGEGAGGAVAGAGVEVQDEGAGGVGGSGGAPVVVGVGEGKFLADAEGKEVIGHDDGGGWAVVAAVAGEGDGEAGLEYASEEDGEGVDGLADHGPGGGDAQVPGLCLLI